MDQTFRPINLEKYFNASTENPYSKQLGKLWLCKDKSPLGSLIRGKKSFWGVPFELAPIEGKYSAIQVAQDAEGVPTVTSVPISDKTRRILIAHVCGQVREGQSNGEDVTLEGTGDLIARYRLVYVDGSTIELPLRRRFEVHDIHVPWGHHPFLCRNCRHFGSVTLDETSIGYGQVQVGTFPIVDGCDNSGSDLDGWWLYDWVNPKPKLEIAQLEIISDSPYPLAIGGITLCDEESDPFHWEHRREVLVFVNDDSSPQIEMKRGEIVRRDVRYVSEEEYLKSTERGWGRGGERKESGGYAEIYGSAAGEILVKGKDCQESINWGTLIDKGRIEQDQVRVEMVSPEGKQWLHVRIEDETTGLPVAARVHFRTQNGAYVAPHGHQADVNIAWFEDMGGDCKVNGVPYAYIDGKCQVDMPVGAIYAEVVRGFEYKPVRRLIEIKPGQKDLTIKIDRAFDMKKRGYYSGDTHVHFLSSQSAHLEAAAEDLNVTHLLVSQWGRLFTSWEEFTGGLAPTSTEHYKIWVSQENRQHVLGHISLLGLKDMIAPICSGGANEDWVGGEVGALMADWSEACRQQGGLVIMPHMPRPDFENAANIVLGQADAGEMCWLWEGEKISSAERGYYRWLNVGQQLPIVGGTDKMSNGRVLGGSRTYARLESGEEFSFENWCQAVKRGATFASTGAMIDLQVEGKPMGRRITLTGNGGIVEIQAFAESVFPLTGIELVVNGMQVAREISGEGECCLKIDYKLKAEKSCWVVARCWSNHYTDAGPVMAHSSPVYVDVGRYRAFVEAEGNYLMTHMEGGIAWAESIGVFRDESVRTRLIGLFDEAKRELVRRMK